jgi:hypothetical protein
MYSYFHGFISLEEAKNILHGIVGGYILRYSQSKMNEGCFVLNINKGRLQQQEIIENYALIYLPEREEFIFNKKPYKSIEEFVGDPAYASILTTPVSNANKFDRYSKVL